MNIRHFAVAATLVLAISLQAQSVLPFAQSYGPYSVPPTGTGRHEIVPNDQGALLVWSEELNGQAVIRFGLIDRDARLVSDLTTIVAPLAADSISPGVATDGTSFLLAWTEVAHASRYDMVRLMALQVDSTGRPVGVPRQLQLPASMLPREHVTTVAWTGSVFDVWGLQSSHFRIQPGGQVEDLSPGAVPYTSIGDQFLKAGWMPITTTRPCGWWWCPRETRWVLVWSTDDPTRHEYSPTAPLGPLAAAGGGNVQLVAWLTKGGIAFVRIQDDRVLSEEVIRSDAWTSAPAVAFDGGEYLLVYLSAQDALTGMLISADGRVSATFPIAGSGWFYDVEADAIAPGRFLVSYRTISGGRSTLHGTIVVPEPVRRRAVR